MDTGCTHSDCVQLCLSHMPDSDWLRKVYQTWFGSERCWDNILGVFTRVSIASVQRLPWLTWHCQFDAQGSTGSRDHTRTRQKGTHGVRKAEQKKEEGVGLQGHGYCVQLFILGTKSVEDTHSALLLCAAQFLPNKIPLQKLLDKLNVFMLCTRILGLSDFLLSTFLPSNSSF